MIKRILIAVVLLALIFIGAIFILPGLVPTDTYRNKLESELSQTFGRNVEISGDIKISTFPAVKIQTGPVSLSNPEGFSESNFVDVDAMSANVRLWPLLRKQVEISGVTLDSPSIVLEKRSDGEVNWTLSDPTKVETKVDESGPYKRDGRYTEYDPSLALLQITNGTLTYTDANSDKYFAAKAINLDLRAPSLNKPVSLSGDLIIDGLPTSLDASMKSPFNFLSGLATPFEARIESTEGTLEATGEFAASEDIKFTARFDSKSDAPLDLAKRLPLPEDVILPSLTSFAANGGVSFEPGVTRLSKLALSTSGNGLSARFSGAVDVAETLTAAGEFETRLDDMSVITPYLEEPIDALNAVSAVDAKGTLDWNGSRLDVQSLNSTLEGPQLKASFTGSAIFEDALSLTGSFDGQSPDLAALLSEANIQQEDAAALKRVTAKGDVSFDNNQVDVKDLTAKLSEGLVNGDFTGQISYTDTLNLKGRFSGDIADLGALDAALPRDIPYSDVAKRISLSSEIASTASGFSFSQLTAALSDGLLVGDFKGQLAIGDESDISGTLSIATNSLRSIANTQSVSMPPSTDVGPIFEAFRLSGVVSGTPKRIIFNNGTLGLDKLSGTGDFTMRMDGDKPLLTGALSLSPLDLRPYMAAWSEQKPQGVILPWSTAPINLAGLDAIDAEINVTTPSVVLDRLELGVTEGAVTLKNGILSSNIEKAQLYDGQVDGRFAISSKGGQPSLSVSADVTSVAAQSFLKAMAGLEKVTGTAKLSLSFEGAGLTQDAIMKSLSGSGSFNVVDGQLLGIDAASLLSGIDEALSSKSVPQGIGIGKITKFNDLEGVFSLKDGRATVGGFQLKSGSLFMDAEGLIDLGGQRLDFGLRPKLAEGSDLAQFGIPLQISGMFGQAKPSLDTQMLAEIAKAKARQSAGTAIRDRVNGPLGDILGGVIGGSSQSDTPTTEPTTEPQPATPLSAPSNDTNTETSTTASGTDERPTEMNTDTPAASDATEPESREDQIENALKDIFGRKKKKSTAE